MRVLLWIFVILLLLLLLVPILLFCVFRYDITVDDGKVTVRIFSFTVYDSERSKRKPRKAKEKPKEKPSEGKKPLLERLKIAKKVYITEEKEIKRLLSLVGKLAVVKRLDIAISFGCGNAAVTGITTGAVWGVLGNIIGFIDCYLHCLSVTNAAVDPDFNKTGFGYKIRLIFRARLYCFLKIVWQVMRLVRRNREEINKFR